MRRNTMTAAVIFIAAIGFALISVASMPTAQGEEKPQSTTQAKSPTPPKTTGTPPITTPGGAVRSKAEIDQEIAAQQKQQALNDCVQKCQKNFPVNLIGNVDSNQAFRANCIVECSAPPGYTAK